MVPQLGVVKRNRIPRPFLKWVGGKSQLLGALRNRIPTAFGTYYEPFVGGGAVFFDLLPSDGVISDSNRELINCYRIVQTDVERLIQALDAQFYDKERFYAVRDEDPDQLNPIARAARTIYLNRTGFNGLYRVNSKGKFNVPFGRYKNPLICDRLNLRGCAKALRGIELNHASFENTLERARNGDFVYLDPPYIPVSDTAYFTAYQSRGFGMENQEKLACVFEELATKGVQVLLSNSAVPWIYDRYGNFKIVEVAARRNINRDASHRGAVSEVLVSNY